MTYLGHRGHGMVICPGWRSGSDGSSGSARGSLGLRRLYRHLNIDPLLRSGKVVTRVPLVFASGIGGAVTEVCIGNVGLCRALIGVAVRQSGRQGGVGTSVDLGQTSVGNGRVGLNSISHLNRVGLGLRRHLVQRSRVGSGREFDSRNYDCVSAS